MNERENKLIEAAITCANPKDAKMLRTMHHNNHIKSVELIVEDEGWAVKMEVKAILTVKKRQGYIFNT